MTKKNIPRKVEVSLNNRRSSFNHLNVEMAGEYSTTRPFISKSDLAWHGIGIGIAHWHLIRRRFMSIYADFS